VISPQIAKIPHVKIRRHQVIIAALIVLGITFLTIGVFHQQDPVKYYAHSLRNWQEADSVAGYPISIHDGAEGHTPEFITAEFQPNLSTMSPMERYRLPTARGFIRPPSDKALAAGTGLVLYTGNPQGHDGKAVLLGHRLPDGSIVQTFYAGLTNFHVRTGQHLPRGALLGSLNEKALYFEVRLGASIDVAQENIAGFLLNSTSGKQSENRLSADEFFATYGSESPASDPLAIIQENIQPTFNLPPTKGGTR
jgi:murein DD-endopeptidase MepM/ murein hydrolase activator NlpD